MTQGEKPDSAEDLFAHFLVQKESNEGLDFDAWLQEYPELEDELCDLARDWGEFEAVFSRAFRDESSTFFYRRSRGAGGRVQADIGSIALRPGGRIDEFELIRMLAEGGMGQVWEAQQTSLVRRVALKFIRPDRINENSVRFFEREARAGGRLNHHGIVSIYTTGETSGVHWIAQELVEGGCTLRDFVAEMRTRPRLPRSYYREVARFFVEIAKAMQVAHEAGVIHRDLKPQNILVTPEDRPKITDFGLARLVDEASVSDAYEMRGTPYYMSPEQASAFDAIDHRTDVFSLGSVLYESLTLQRPFEGDTTAEICRRILERSPPSPGEVNHDVPRELAVICMRALEKDKTDRFATMREVAEELERFLNDEPILTRPPGPIRRARKWMVRHPTKTTLVGLGSALLLSVSAMAVAFSLQRGRAETWKRDTHVLRAELAIEAGDMERAEEQIRLAAETDPDDPHVHLVLARGYARYARFEKVERELNLSIEKGFRSDPSELEDALDHYWHGLYLLATKKQAGFEEAEEHLSTALALDPSLYFAYYPLYQVRSALGDVEGAKEAVRVYRGRIGEDEDFYPVVNALFLELDGKYDEAIAVLREVEDEADADPERLDRLHIHRNLGRNHLRKYLEALRGPGPGGPADPADLDQAEALLLQAVEELPLDGSSLINLSTIELLRYQQDPTADDAPDRLARAIEYADQGRIWDAGLVPAHRNAAVAAAKRFDRLFDPNDPPGEEAWRALEDRLDDLRSIAPDDAALGRMDAHIHYLKGLMAQALGASGEAMEHYAESRALNPRHVPARVRLAQYLLEDEQDPRSSLEELEAAQDAWEELAVDRRDSVDPTVMDPEWGRRWLFAIHAWTFGAASKLGEVDTALQARAAMDRELDADDREAAIEELFSYAEFLATTELEELRDCERAMEILNTYDLRRRLAEIADAYLAKIDASCR